MYLSFRDLTRLATSDAVPAEIKNFSQAFLRAPSFAAGIKNAQQLLADRPDYAKLLAPGDAPDARVEGKTAEALARSDGGTREFRGTATETVPEQFTVAQILEGNRKLWMQGPVAPAIANRMEADLLRAANDANRKFWQAH